MEDCSYKNDIATADLLSAAYNIGGWYNLFVGASRDDSDPPLNGWSWIDGTSADNLNCGEANCGPWSYDQPE